MKSFDELLSMTDEEKLAYLHEESEKIINSASPRYQLKLRALKAKCDGMRARIKDPFVSANRMYYTMQDSLMELNDSLAPFRKD